MASTIYVTCYGERKRWTSRREAQAFYLEAMRNSEGSEHERYAKIYCELCDGLSECTDEY